MISNRVFVSSHPAVRFSSDHNKRNFNMHLDLPPRPNFDRPDEEGASPGTPGTPSLLQKIRLLIAEDNPINRRVLEGAVKKYNKGKPEHLQFDYEMTTDGQEAFDSFQKKRPDISLLDHEMPNMSGIEATKAIKSYSATHTPQAESPEIFMLSASKNMANSGKGGEKVAKEAGVDEYFDKGTNIQKILETAAQRVHHRRRTSGSSTKIIDSTGSISGLGIMTESPLGTSKTEKDNPFNLSRTPSFKLSDHSDPSTPLVLSDSGILSRSGLFIKTGEGIPEEEEHHS